MYDIIYYIILYYIILYYIILYYIILYYHHLPPWIRSFDLFRHRRVAIFSWGVHDLFSPEVCS